MEEAEITWNEARFSALTVEEQTQILCELETKGLTAYHAGEMNGHLILRNAFELGRKVFSHLNSGGKSSLLNCAESCGAIASIAGDQNQALRDFRFVIEHGCSLFAELNLTGQGAVIESLVYAAQINRNKCDHQVFGWYEKAIELGSPKFPKLTTNVQGVLISAFAQLGDLYVDNGCENLAIQYYMQAVDLAKDNHARLSKEDQEIVFAAAINAANLEKDSSRSISESIWNWLISHGSINFADYTDYGQESILVALSNSQDGREKSIEKLPVAIVSAIESFDKLSYQAQALTLKVLVNISACAKNRDWPGDKETSQNLLDIAIQFAEQFFHLMSTDAQVECLRAFLYRGGLIHEVYYYERILVLNGAKVDRLGDEAAQIVGAAHYFIGKDLIDTESPNYTEALEHFTIILDSFTLKFHDFPKEHQTWILNACALSVALLDKFAVSEDQIETIFSHVDFLIRNTDYADLTHQSSGAYILILKNYLDYMVNRNNRAYLNDILAYGEVLRLDLSRYLSTFDNEKIIIYFTALGAYCASLYNHKFPCSNQLSVLLGSQTTLAAATHLILAQIVNKSSAYWRRQADPDSADEWLGQMKAFPSQPRHRTQANIVIQLAHQRLLARNPQSTSIGRMLLHFALDATPVEQVLVSISRHIAQQHNWPTQINTLAQRMLVILCAKAPELLPAQCNTNWEPDVPAILHALGFQKKRNAALYQTVHDLLNGWNAILPHISRCRNHSAHVDELASLLQSWYCDDDHNKIIQPLIAAWDQFALAPNVWLGQIAPIDSLANWLAELGIEDAWQLARQACLLGGCDSTVAHALEQDIPSEFTLLNKVRDFVSRILHRPKRRPINAYLQLISPYRDTTETAMLRTLAHFVRGALEAATCEPEDAWKLLEASRIGLIRRADIAKGNLRWDAESLADLTYAENRALASGRRIQEAKEKGLAYETALTADLRIEPFATMAEQWQRQGLDVSYILPLAARAELTTKEVLLQIWWDTYGKAHALALNHNGELVRIELPEELRQIHWAKLLGMWSYAHDEAKKDGSDPQTSTLEVYHSVWQASLEDESCTYKLLSWLRDNFGSSCILILPAELAKLPWQALASEMHFSPPELAVSVSTWMLARHNKPPAKVKNAAFIASDVIAEQSAQSQLERFSTQYHLRATPRTGEDFSHLLQALSATGSVHLGVHGFFNECDPQRSGFLISKNIETENETSISSKRSGLISVRRYDPIKIDLDTSCNFVSLPAWLLLHCEIQGDISLATCESMQAGLEAGDSSALGPIGLAPALMTAGARSVVGSLWSCEAWASAVFFHLWYEARESLDGLAALAKARLALRTFSEDELIILAKKVNRKVADAARLRCQVARELGWETPFAHPWCWATFTLLGNPDQLVASV